MYNKHEGHHAVSENVSRHYLHFADVEENLVYKRESGKEAGISNAEQQTWYNVRNSFGSVAGQFVGRNAQRQGSRQAKNNNERLYNCDIAPVSHVLGAVRLAQMKCIVEY